MTVHSSSLKFYKLDDIVLSSSNTAQLNYYGQLAPAASDASHKASSTFSMSGVLQPGESIQKAFFGDGPIYYIPEEEGGGFIEDINGNYTLYVKTNKRVFSTKVKLQFSGSSITASAVPNSTEVIYGESEIGSISLFDKKHSIYN